MQVHFNQRFPRRRRHRYLRLSTDGCGGGGGGGGGENRGNASDTSRPKLTYFVISLFI